MNHVRLLHWVGCVRIGARAVPRNDVTSGGAVAAPLLALVGLLSLALVGCGSKFPFPLAPVEGKITYTDGSLIEADQIVLKFIPQGIAAKGKAAPQAAQTRVDVADGSFRDFTTWKYADGVMVGKHKVVAISSRIGSHGMDEPTGAIPERYHELDTTPLDVEVSAGGDDNLLLEIEKG